MKKILACILVLALMLASFSVVAEEAETIAEPIEFNFDQLVVGETTAFNGNFFSSMFGTNTSDLDVQNLIHGYNLVLWNDDEGGFEMDPSVVSGMVITQDPQGNHTFNLVLYDDLYFSDGNKITAKDYAFSILLSMAPQIREIGGSINGSDAILGADEFKSGEADVISGVQVKDELQLAVTIKAEYLPFFYEKGLLNYYPYPIQAIAPGCSVADDGLGVYIDGKESFTADLLKGTILDETNGYLTYPSVVSGPYKPVSFDGEAVTFAINEYYKGNADGEMPLIPEIIFKHVTNEEMFDQLASGELGLINKSVLNGSIEEGRQMVQDGGYAMGNYPRVGQSYISFCCEKSTVSSQAVRQAIAYCMAKDKLVADYVGDYGLRVDGYYGIGQWMYQVLTTGAYPIREGEEEAMTPEWEALNFDDITVYDLDTKAAEKLLEDDGWTLNADGVRSKEIDGETVTLKLTMIYPEGNTIAGALQEYFVKNLEKVGIQVEMQGKPMDELLRIYYRQEERNCDMIYLATNYTTVFDPAPVFDPADAETGTNNRTGIQDDELFELAVDMRKTEPGDVLTYCKKWLVFQARFSEVLPMIPVYSNVYFDFYTSYLQEYTAGEGGTWAKAIVGSYLTNVIPEEAEEGEVISE